MNYSVQDHVLQLHVMSYRGKSITFATGRQQIKLLWYSLLCRDTERGVDLVEGRETVRCIVSVVNDRDPVTPEVGQLKETLSRKSTISGLYVIFLNNFFVLKIFAQFIFVHKICST